MNYKLPDGQTLDYVEYSAGELPIIFLHGIISSHPQWLDFPQKFTHLGRVISLSLPGHYPATFPADFRQNMLTDAWVGDTLGAAIRDLTGGRPALLIGFSTGGYAALAVAWRHPELVRQVISLAGFARGKGRGLLGLCQNLQKLGKPGDWLFEAILRTAQLNATTVKLLWKWHSYDKNRFEQSAFNRYLPEISAYTQKLDGDSIRKWLYQLQKVADLTPHLREINAPVLAIAGEKDALVPPNEARHIANHVRNGFFKLVPQLNHLVYVEQPELIYRLITEWLAREESLTTGFTEF